MDDRAGGEPGEPRHLRRGPRHFALHLAPVPGPALLVGPEARRVPGQAGHADQLGPAAPARAQEELQRRHRRHLSEGRQGVAGRQRAKEKKAGLRAFVPAGAGE